MPELTVILPTYNKAKYVAQALDSVFAQKTSRSCQVIVADDCSSDGTLDVVARYEARHPGIIRVLRSDRNQRLFRNVIRAYALTDTPYFCVLDPDDYWTDDALVETALAYLDEHPDFTIYSANVSVRDSRGAERPYCAEQDAADADFREVLTGRGVLGQTAGLFYRNLIFSQGLPRGLDFVNPEQEMCFRGDSFRNFIHLLVGRVHFDPICRAVYRITDEGLWQGMSELRKRIRAAQFFVAFDGYLGFRHQEVAARARHMLAGVRYDLPSLIAQESDLSATKDSMSLLLDLEMRMSFRQPERRPHNPKRWIRSRLAEIRKARLLSRCKYVHLMFNDKFAKPFVDFLNRNFDPDEHLVLCKRWFGEHPFPEGRNVLEVKRFIPMDFSGGNIRKVICHSLFDREVVELLYANGAILQEKAYWSIWGADLYRADRTERNDYVRRNVRGCIDGVDREYALAKYGMRDRFFDLLIYSPIDRSILDAARKLVVRNGKPRIQLNNSCDRSTIGLLEALAPHAGKIIPTTVLSYGDLHWRDAVREMGRRLFGDDFEVLEDYLPRADYARYMASNDILILNQDRQQGIGNTGAMLYLGKKVFIRGDVATNAYFKAHGMAIHDTESVPALSLAELLRYDDAAKSRTILAADELFFDEKERAEAFNRFLLED